MKSNFAVCIILCLALFSSCKNSSESKITFCDTTCLNDTLKFNTQHPQKPYVYISADDCIADTVIWSHASMPNNLKIDFNEFAESGVRINKEKIACYFKDTAYAWLEFNDCLTGRGYLVKLNFNKKEGRQKYSSALTRFDPKFKIEDGIICYADYTFVYAQDIATGNIQKLLLADHELNIDFNNIHATFDSAHVTRNRIFVSLIENGIKKPLEKTISL